MELKQLEYFTVVCAKGSFNKAAECLYTTQPNVSKVIAGLEKELGRPLFERTARGIQVTPYGHTIMEYSQNILHNISLINGMADQYKGKKFTVSTYPSNILARILTDFYKFWKDEFAVEHMEGSVEEITNQVSQGISEIGIVYVAQKQLQTFQHILSHKRLRFEVLDVKEACVYLGPNHPRYGAESIDFSELNQLSFVTGVRDFFSMEHHLEHVSLGSIRTENLHYAVYSNSDHVMIDMLTHTDACSLGINFMCDDYRQYEIQPLKIKNCEPFLAIGYVCPEEGTLSEAAEWFIEKLRQKL